MFDKYKIGIVRAILLCLMTAAAVWIFLHNPEESDCYPECIFYQSTKLYCPGCGGIRAIYYFLHGEFGKSFRCNLLICPLAIWFIAALFLPYLRKIRWIILIIFICTLYMIMRNLNFAFTEFLHP